jgi:hypothetical protein
MCRLPPVQPGTRCGNTGRESTRVVLPNESRPSGIRTGGLLLASDPDGCYVQLFGSLSFRAGWLRGAGMFGFTFRSAEP